jgi:hypothetical protein
MMFEWDDEKSSQRVESDGFGFDFAALIFDGPTIEWPDERRNYGEQRVIALGEASGLMLVVVYTDRGEVRRIISARPANKKERARWRSFAGL